MRLRTVWKRRGLAAAALVATLLVGFGAEALPNHPCLAVGADCTLRQIADAAGVRVGAAAQPGPLASDPLYGPTLAAEFNSLTAENQMKWPQIHPANGVYDFAPADALAQFAQDNGMRMRGHTLLWANPLRIPAWVSAAPDATTLEGWLDEHIRTVVGRYQDDVDAWDVINEPLQNLGSDLFQNVFLDLLGPDYIADAFRIAHEVDPDAQLFLNEVLITNPGTKFDAFFDLVAGLVASGVPIHGVGLQGHVVGGFVQPSAEGLREVIEAFAALGLVVEITEFDMVMSSNSLVAQAIQGEIYEELLSVCLELTACQGITFWGFTDRYTWIDGTFGPGRIPLPLDADYARKPAYEGARRALLGRLAVPEPSLWLLMASAALGIGARRRQRR